MNMKVKNITKRKAAGKKREDLEILSSSFAIHSINTCPLYAYIDAVCDGNLKGLVVSGNPTEEALKESLSILTAEFSALCGNGRASSVNNSIRKIYMLRNTITAYSACMTLISVGDYSCLEVLSRFGIKAKEPKTDAEKAKLLKLIDSKARSKSVSLKEELSRLENTSKEEESGKVTVQDYNEQIALVSKFSGFHINRMTITLSEYAAYVKQFNKSLEIK
ncbi:hypothetical protein M2459_001346 [Parabacteroides sp. PF5-5]|uniref:hypothetical protein n=1 Tax=unclassified Parabacteroides TaxID=2649774 RepID=UPI00247326FD|nr:MULTISPECIES: hypothetical protein [unclassified Parabacteroides]MDH6304611.1 hypothetical protein [Parabacteroides sp. PH5-39]MDH6315776.1 hypothetical protein [Parabacteroides sp. PF5-13]MDH6319435.1 hypothetical protein [Parabacteroides sp. PH5-13]MDH6323166.1 hypothetical protein [Parabacteroides sp. PH5-8]MDH6326968.1 hypothetical protein [Parabacteroides sp. PH5-41]